MNENDDMILGSIILDEWSEDDNEMFVYNDDDNVNNVDDNDDDILGSIIPDEWSEEGTTFLSRPRRVCTVQ